MNRSGICAAVILFVCLLSGMLSSAWGASDGYYTVTESAFTWDGTDANLLNAPASEYDYTYGDEKSVTYNLPWNLPFYSQNYSRIVADTNGNLWFTSSDAANTFNLTNTGRGPAVALWNNDLSSSYNGGVFIQHKTGPERIVIEWQTETYTEEGFNVPNTFAAILYPDGVIRLNYKTFSTQSGNDAGSGITRGDGSAYLDLKALYGSAFTLAGRSFQFSPQSQVAVSVSRNGAGAISSIPSGIDCGTHCSAYFTQGKTVELTATPGFGSVFDSWTGACTGNSTCSLTVDSAKDVSATFLETFAPAIVINSPAGITTSRPMLNYAVSTGTTVVKVDGVIVNKVSGNLLDTLTAGTHTVRVEATNSAGHLGFAESSFMVDGTPPTVTLMIPSANSSNVPVRMSVLVQFSKQIDPTSVTASTASLVSKGLPVPGDLRIAGDGKSLIFKPQSKLNYAASYTFTLKAGLRDLFGNTISSDIVSTFSTPMADQDLAGYWPMDGDWNDYSAYGNNGTSSGSASFSAGRTDGISSAGFVIDSKDFNGSGGAVTTSPKIIEQISNTFTMSFWAKPTATRESTAETNATQVLGEGIQRFAIAPMNAFNLGYQGATAGVSVGTNGISVFEETTTDGLFRYMPSLLVYDTDVPLTGWNHIAVVYNNKQPSLYLNGVLIKTGQASLQKNVYPSAVFAYGNERPTGAYSGQMEGVVYHKRALTALEIQTLYQGQTQALPHISITSPGQTIKFKPGESGSATVSVSSTSGIARLFCSASGAASDGGLAINFDSPVLSTTQQLNFQVGTNAAVPIVLSCVAQTTDGLFGVAELQLQPMDLVSPAVVSSIPVNNAVDVSAAMPISITFSEAMDSASFILNDTFRFQRADTGKLVTGTFTLSTDSKTLSFIPSPALEASTHYTVTVSRVRDIAGNTLENDFVFNFLTLQQPTLNIVNMGSSTTPYVLAPGRYGTLSLTNSYVSLKGDTTVDNATLANSTLNISSIVAGSPGNLNVTYGDLTLTDSFMTIAGGINISGNINQTNSALSITGISAVSGNVALANSTITTAKTTQVTGDITLQNQSVLTHFAATLTDTSKLDISAATVNVDATSKIDVSGKGYLGAYQGANNTGTGRTLGNTTTLGSYYSSGGSYGGLGGNSPGYQVNAVYGDPADPNDIGSGGGGNGDSYPGGNGGGLLRLKAKNLILNGSILADAGNTSYSGGSGGGIRLDIGTLTGSGTISAKGGVSASSGGGSGGRIAIYYWDNSAYNGSVTVAGGTGGKTGSVGTLYWKSAYQDYADLQIDNSGLSNAQTTLPAGRYGNVVVKNTTIVLSGSVTASSISLQDGSILTSKATSINSVERLVVSAATFTIDSTSRIDVTALGYLGGRSGGTSGNTSNYGLTYGNTATGGSYYYNGGSYGGLGGINNSSYAVGGVYGDPLDPSDPGSGGGSYQNTGGNGGGVIRIRAGTLTVDGSILADGGNTSSTAGGGSGGSIRIDATMMDGSGIIRAKGGNNTSSGAGGGGRIALYYGTMNLPQANISATGGTGLPSGGPGSIYFKDSTMTRGRILIDNRGIDTAAQLTPLPGVDRGQVSAITATSLTSSTGGWLSGALKGQKFNPNLAQDKTFTIIDNSATTLYIDPKEGDLSQVAAVGSSYAGIFNPESITITGKARILSAGKLQVTDELIVDGGSLYTAYNDIVADKITVKNSGLIAHLAATTSATYKLELNALTLLTIDATSRIDVTALGYLGGGSGGNSGSYGRTYGNTTTGGSSNYNGGSYGGLGGKYDSNYAVNSVYGDPLDPGDPGSGGGRYLSSIGGNGGGVIGIKAGTLTVDGSILADGGNTSSTAGGGSGGSIRIDATVVGGSGIIRAKGGNAGNGGGAGGGGRIAIYYGTLNLPQANISVSGGTGATTGGAGSLLMKSQTASSGDLIIDNQGTVVTPTQLQAGHYQNIIIRGALVNLQGPISADTITLSGGTLVATYPIEANSLTLINGALLTKQATGLSGKEILDLKITGTLGIDATSRIDVTALGYLGGGSSGNSGSYGRTYGNTTTGGSSNYNGGSYGGLGGKYNSTYAVNSVYGDPLDPSDPGSGGGNSPYYSGGNGGGVIRIKAGTLTVDGSILADGGNAGGGAGSGGSIRIDATVVGGSGIIRAKGGNAGGAGGGGRIALYYGTLNLAQANISATGGTGSTNGGPGSIYFKDSTMTRGRILIDNRGIDTAAQLTPLPGVDRGQVSAITATSLTSSTGGWLSGALKGQKFNPNLAQDKTFTIIDNSATTLYIDPKEGDLSQVAAVGSSYAGIFSPESITITGKSRILSAGKLQVTGELIVDGGSLYTAYNDIVADKITVKNSGLIGHLAATTSATYKLELNALTLLSIDATSKIEVTALGYLGGRSGANSSSSYGRTFGNTTTGGSYYENGGSYGGLGGKYNSTYAVNSVYGDPLDPSDPGSGGGNNPNYGYIGGNGGGVIRIMAGTLTVDGSILADGGNTSGTAGGGSGGSIRIVATVVGGSGIIRAKGGNNNASAGGGGGGRIALYYGTLNLAQANISVSGGTGATSGGAGSLLLKSQAAPSSDLIIDNQGTVVTPTQLQAGHYQKIIIHVPPLSISLSAPSITSDHQGTLGISIRNITPSGSEVLVEQFIDTNRNGIVDAADYTIRSFKVSDGIVSGSPNLQGDEDVTVDSSISTSLNYLLANDLYHAPGQYLFRATKGAETATTPFTVDPVSHVQTMSGTITDGTNPIPGALIRLQDKWQRPVAWTTADGSGSYTFNIKQPGDYFLTPIAYGYVAPSTLATIASSQNIVNQTLSVTAGSYHITGHVIDSANSTGIGGVWVQATGTTTTAVAITSTDGSYDLVLPSGQYAISALADNTVPGVFAKGYTGYNNYPLNVTVNGNAAGMDIVLTNGTIQVSGKVIDPIGNVVQGLPVAGKILNSIDVREPVTFGSSDAFGNYSLTMFSGTNWDITIDNSAAQSLGYLGSIVHNVSTTVTPLTGHDLTVHPITAWIQGTVKDTTGKLLSNVNVQLHNADSSIITNVFTAQDGSYRLGAFAGSWFVDAMTAVQGLPAVPEQTVTITDTQVATKDFIVDVTAPQ